MTSVKDVDWEHDHDNRISSNTPNAYKMKTLLDSKGCGFCLAKWTQLTLHLGSGLTHSCHHPVPHKIPLEELKDNPSALHNTLRKKAARKQMLNDERPDECDYCWRIEDGDQSGNNFSDRVYKSLATFSINEHDNISNMSGDEDVYPTYLEVSFSNVCNFSCSYCNPNFSSKWQQEVKNLGWYELPYEGYNWVSEENLQIPKTEDNPYTDAFWKWFPEAKKHLHTLRITGGEPLMSKHTFKLLEEIRDNPTPQMELCINTNGNAPTKNWKRFLELIIDISNNNKVKKVTLFASCEGWGERAEYSRDGLDFDTFCKNIEDFLEKTKTSRVVFMSAFNIFAVTNFLPFLKWVLQLKKEYNFNGLHQWLEDKTQGLSTNVVLRNKKNNPELIPDRPIKSMSDRYNEANQNPNERVGIDIAYVRYPDFLDVTQIIGNDGILINYLIPALHFMHSNNQNTKWTEFLGFNDFEIDKLDRIVNRIVFDYDRICNGTLSEKYVRHRLQCRARFFSFVKEYDKRRSKNFLETFPELENLYKRCEMDYDEIEAEAEIFKNV